MAHRIGAVVLLVAAGLAAWRLRRDLGPRHLLVKFSLAWAGLILAQASLGAATVLTNKAADIATLHVVIGAVSLVSISLATGVSCRLARQPAAARVVDAGHPASPHSGPAGVVNVA